jgi:hypothetical protein
MMRVFDEVWGGADVQVDVMPDFAMDWR